MDLDNGPALLSNQEKLVMVNLLRRYIQENPEMKDSSFSAIEKNIFVTNARKQTVLDSYFINELTTTDFLYRFIDCLFYII